MTTMTLFQTSLLLVALVGGTIAQIHPRNNHQPRQKLGDQPKCGEPNALPSLYGLICDNNMGLFEPTEYGNQSFDQSFDIFCDAIQETDLDEVFESSGRISFFGKPHDIDDADDKLTETSFTVFAPTNQAFTNLPKATGDEHILEYLLSEDGHATLNTIIVNHFVVANIITPNEIQCNSDTDTGILDDGKSSTTICGSIFGPIYQVGPGNTKEAYRPTYSSGSDQRPSHNVSPVAPVYACNGIMYIMDNVILPTLPVRVVSASSTATATATTPTAPPSSSFLRGKTAPVLIEEASVQEEEPETDTADPVKKKPTTVKKDQTPVEEESSTKAEKETAVKGKEQSSTQEKDKDTTTVETTPVGESIKKKDTVQKESSSTNNKEEDPITNNPTYGFKGHKQKLTCQEIKNEKKCDKKLKKDKDKRKGKDVCPQLCNLEKKKSNEEEKASTSNNKKEQQTTTVDDETSSSVINEEASTQQKKDPSKKNPPTYRLRGEETQWSCYEIKKRELCHTKLKNEERTAKNVCPKLCTFNKSEEEESTIKKEQEITVETTPVEVESTKKDPSKEESTQEEKVVATPVTTTTPATNKKLTIVVDTDTTTPIEVAVSNQKDLLLPPNETYETPKEEEKQEKEKAASANNEGTNKNTVSDKKEGTTQEETDNKKKEENNNHKEEEKDDTNDE